jgi:predicted transposase/invertase (TIGR01784 family)
MIEKFARLDLVLTQPNGTKINVEVQNSDESNYKERSVFNCSKMFTKDLKSGDEYKDIPRTICINIVQFPLFKDSGCICTVFPTIQETGEIVTNKWEIIYFQTTKLPKDKQGGIWDWIKLFTITTREELETMENTMTSGVKRAAVVLKQMNADDRMKEIARVHEKAKMMEYYALKHSREAGIEEANLSNARKMLAKGFSIADISDITDLPIEKIQEISANP